MITGFLLIASRIDISVDHFDADNSVEKSLFSYESRIKIC